MNAQRLAIAVTLVNLVLLAILLGQASTTSAQTEGAVLRGRALELVDASGHVRAQYQRVDKETDQPFNLGTVPIRYRRAYHDVVLLRVAIKQRLKSCQ